MHTLSELHHVYTPEIIVTVAVFVRAKCCSVWAIVIQTFVALILHGLLRVALINCPWVSEDVCGYVD